MTAIQGGQHSGLPLTEAQPRSIHSITHHLAAAETFRSRTR